MTKILAFNFMISLLGMSVAYAEFDKEATCPPRADKSDCHKIVAEKFKACADTVTSHGNVKNNEALEQCKEFAKKRKEDCNQTCKK